MDSFPRNVAKKLKYYVYLYIDPRDNTIFYVGKGKNNRAFSHLKEKSEKEKVLRIKEIMEAGLKPRIEILVHGIEDEYTAKKIEASVIDILDKKNLTNVQSGYESKEFGRMTIEQVISLYSADEIKINDKHKVILIRINRTFRYSMSPIELYDVTRSAWKINPEKHKAEYAFAVYNSIVQEVYEIATWLPSGASFNTKNNGYRDTRKDRWEFIGKIAKEEVRNIYRFKDVSYYLQSGNQNPIKYVNC